MMNQSQEATSYAYNCAPTFILCTYYNSWFVFTFWTLNPLVTGAMDKDIDNYTDIVKKLAAYFP